MEYDATLSYHGINFGLMEGKTGLLIVKTGSGGSIYGKDNKYLRLSERMKSVYGAKIAEGRTHYNALGHCAGKLVRIIWKIMTDNVSFNLE